MSKKLTSTLLLFAVFIGFLAWGLTQLVTSIQATPRDGETIFYSILLLGCSGVALIAILSLPRKKM
ncbi:hypothetical protein [Tengunoibacter tsumagoiensis]|uniref:DUF3955 domain-containing protein n=1 Tax=Tengunoibacter tsumagoiensis TaxID=2014871 RepID=A0A402A2X3_9CHLR|nr:hypothetical protein [Tengunoibacter tsumagoiensis]GCE13361.1 hypothetical protein KTT_32200 [Tengunoibacter tsumagoiensis]